MAPATCATVRHVCCRHYCEQWFCVFFGCCSVFLDLGGFLCMSPISIKVSCKLRIIRESDSQAGRNILRMRWHQRWHVPHLLERDMLRHRFPFLAREDTPQTTLSHPFIIK